MVRKLLLGAALSGVLAAAAPALAQTGQAWTWTGPYAGVNIGYSFGTQTYNYAGTDDAAGTIPDYGGFYHDLGGVIGGGQLGYNYETSGGLVLGIETDFDATSQSFSDGYSGTDGNGNAYSGNIASRLDWLGTVRARLGQASFDGRFFPYVTGGLAYGRVTGAGTFSCPTCAAGEGGGFNASEIQAGWTVGVGAEYAVNRRLSAKVEYLYVQMPTEAFNLPNGGFGGPGVAVYNAQANQQLDTNIIRVGLNYHF